MYIFLILYVIMFIQMIFKAGIENETFHNEEIYIKTDNFFRQHI